MIRLAIALLIVLAGVTTAQADPVTLIATAIATLLPSVGPISLAAGAGFGIATGTWAAATGLAYAVIGVALLGANALLGRLPSVPPPGAAKETFSSSDSAELRGLGRIRVGGLKAYGNTHGDNRYRLTLHCKGRIDAIEEYILGGRSVTVESDGVVSSPPWTKAGGAWCYLNSKLGIGDETAWPDLIADFPDIWTTAHRVRGIAQTLAKFVNPGLSTDKFLQLYQNGVPDVEVVLRAEYLYDPRTETTAWGDNGVLAILHVALSSYTFLSLSDFDIDFIKAEADRVDAMVATKAGVDVPRARAWGVWTSETARGENMQSLLDSVGAELVTRPGNKIGIALVDDVPVSELTIGPRDIVSIDWQSGPSGVARPNRCTVTYYSPERNYDKGQPDMTTVAWANVASEIAAYGEQKLEIQLPFNPSSGPSQRRARQMFAYARADSGIVRTNMVGLACFGCRFVTFEMPDDLGSLLCKIGPPRVLDDQGQVEIPFVVWPTLSPYSVETDEAAAPEQIPELEWGGGLTTPDTPTTMCVVTYPDASHETRFGYVVPEDAEDGTAEAVYRTYSGSLPSAWLSMTEYPSSGTTFMAYVGSDLTGIVCDFRVRTFSVDGDDGSPWSDMLHATGAVINTAPSAPALTLIVDTETSMITVNVVAPADLHVAYLKVNGGASVPIRPVETYSFTEAAPDPGDTVTYTAIAYASDGTASPSDSESYTAPL